MNKKIVVLGAGYAGVLTAKKLAKRLRKDSGVEIVLIDKHPFHTMLTELHEVAAWRVEEDSIKIDLKRVFAGRNVRVVLDTITAIDYEQKTLTGEDGTYAYDFLVLASGSQPAFFGVPGAQEHSFTLWSYEDAVRLREHVLDMFRRAALEKDDANKRELLTFCVVGAGFTGVEMAGELAELVPILCNRFELDRSLVTMINADILERIMPILPDKLSAKAQRRLEKMGVDVMLGTNICEVGEGYFVYEKNGKRTRVETATVIWTAGIEGSEVAKASTALELVKRGRVQTDPFLRAKGRTDVYIGGDNIFYIPEGSGEPVPQMVENCEACADTIAHNLLCEVTGRGEMESYKPKFHGTMASIGGRYGVAHVGTDKRKFALASFFAMFSKHFINVIYFIQVLGWNKVFSYLHHEFFTIRHCRSFVGGHLSNRTPSFLLVPLRVFLGFYWLYEGWVKVQEGWLSDPKLTGFFKGASAYYDQLLSGASGASATAAADAVSAATAAAPAAGAAMGNPVLINWNIFGFIQVILVNAGEVAFKLRISFVDWIINGFVLPSYDMQMTFQIVIVVAEILIGLSLMAGLFTFLSSGASLLLQVMFVTSTGLYMTSWWMVFAAIAVLIGGGRVFGLDYWVMPALKSWWRNRRFAKKWYVYND